MATTQENRIIFSIEFTEKGAIRKNRWRYSFC